MAERARPQRPAQARAAPGTRSRAGRSTCRSAIYLVFTLIPFYWILLFALRQPGSTSLVPWPMTFEHFEKVWNERSFGIYFQNSVLVGVATLLMTTLVALAGGYALARFDFKIKRGFMLALLCSQFVPGALLLVPLFQIFAELQMINSLGSVIIAETVFQLPLSIILISGFIRNVPYSLEEAAWVDGCNRLHRVPGRRAAAAAARSDRRRLLRLRALLEPLPVRPDVPQQPGQADDPGRPQHPDRAPTASTWARWRRAASSPPYPW